MIRAVSRVYTKVESTFSDAFCCHSCLSHNGSWPNWMFFRILVFSWVLCEGTSSMHAKHVEWHLQCMKVHRLLSDTANACQVHRSLSDTANACQVKIVECIRTFIFNDWYKNMLLCPSFLMHCYSCMCGITREMNAQVSKNILFNRMSIIIETGSQLLMANCFISTHELCSHNWNHFSKCETVPHANTTFN